MNGLDKAGQPEILQAAKTALIRLETADRLLCGMNGWGWLDRLAPAAAALLRRAELQDSRRAAEKAQAAVRALLEALQAGGDARFSGGDIRRLEEFASMEGIGPAAGQPLRRRVAEARARIAAAAEAIRAACALTEAGEPEKSRLPGASRDEHRD